jgi:hypothetical protein
MIKRALAVLLLICFCTIVNPLSAQAKDILGSASQCSSTTAGTGNSAVCTDSKTANGNPNDNPVIDKLQAIATIVAIIAGAAAVLLLLVGSLQYITSNGDSNKAASAKNTIVYALVGIAVIALAATIIEFVVNKL